MGQYRATGPISGAPYDFQIAGDTPTADERLRMDAIFRQREPEIMQEIQGRTGMEFDIPDFNGGIMDQINEPFKGLGSGAVSLGESAALGLAALLPERFEDPTREFIRNKAIDYREPFAPDYGLEDSLGGKVGQAFGSTLPFFATAALGPAGIPVAAGLGVFSGVGEASERAREAGATLEERNLAAFKGAGPGALEAVPVASFIKFLGPNRAPGFLASVGRIATEGGIEAAQEAVSEALQNAIQQGYDPEQEIIEGLGESAALGGTVGATIQGIVELTLRQRGRTPSNLPPRDDEPVDSDSPVVTPDAEGVEPGTQLEMDLGADLGQAPTQEVQGELDLPAGQDTRQLSLPQVAEPFAAAVMDTADAVGLPQNTVTEVYGRLATATDEDAALRDIESVLGVPPRVAQQIQADLNLSLTPEEQAALSTAPEPTAEPEVETQPAPVTEADVEAVAAPVVDTTPGEVTPEEQPIPEAAEGVALQDIQDTVEETQDATGQLAEDVEDLTREVEQDPEAVPDDVSAAMQETLAAAGVPLASPIRKAIERNEPRSQLRTRLGNYKSNRVAAQRALDILDGRGDGRTDSGPDSGRVSGDTSSATDRRDAGAGRETGGVDGPTLDSDPRGVPDTDGPAASPSPTVDWAAVERDLDRRIARKQRQERDRKLAPNVARFLEEQAAAKDAPPDPATEAQDNITAAESIFTRVGNLLDADELAYVTKLGSYGADQLYGFEASNMATRADPTNSRDKRAILDLLMQREWKTRKAKPSGVDKDVWSAVQYFSHFPNPADALLHMAYDAVHSSGTTNIERTRDKGDNESVAPIVHKFYAKLNATTAKAAKRWVDANLSPETQSFLAAAVTDESNAANRIKNYIKNAGSAANQNAETLQRPLHPAARVALLEGDIRGALLAIAMSSENPSYRRLARILSDYVGDTQALVYKKGDAVDTAMEQYFMEEGKPRPDVNGAYTPVAQKALEGVVPDNSIAIREEGGMNDYVVLHEAMHMATLAARALNPTAPAVMQLEKLYADTKDAFPDAEDIYGFKNVDEFMAEAFTNEQFANLLKRTTYLRSNMWDRLVDSLARLLKFMGIRTNRPLNVHDELKELVSNIAAPPYTQDFYSGYKPSMDATQSQALLKNVAGRVKNFGPDDFRKVNRVLTDNSATEKTKSIFLGFVPLPNMAEFLRPYLAPFGVNPRGLDEIVGKHSAFITDKNEVVDATLSRINKEFMRNHKDKVPDLNDLLITSSYEGVDLRKPRSTYENDPDKLQAWKSMQDTWNDIGEAGRNAYGEIAGLFQQHDALLAQTLRDVLETYSPDNAVMANAMLKQLNELLAQPRNEFYYPFMRSGKYWLSYNATDPRFGNNELFKLSFETASERAEYIKDLNAVSEEFNVSNIQPYTNMDQLFRKSQQGDSMPHASLQKITGILNQHGSTLGPDAKEEISKMLLDMMPERSVLHSYRRRGGADNKGVRGMIGDVDPVEAARRASREKYEAGGPNLWHNHDFVRITKNRSSSLIRQAARMRYNREAQQWKAELERAFTNGQLGAEPEVTRDEQGRPLRQMTPDDYVTPKAMALLQEMATRADQVLNIDRAWWSRQLTGMGFMYTLGLNASSALINTLALPSVVMPYLGGIYGIRKSGMAMAKAAKIHAASGHRREIESVDADGNIRTDVEKTSWLDYSLDNYDFSDPSNASLSHYKTLLDYMKLTGNNNRSMAHDINEVMSNDSANPMEKARSVAGYVFHHSEKFAREVTMIAGYDLQRQKTADEKYGGDLNKLTDADNEFAAREAIRHAEMSNGAIAAAAAPRWAQGNVGSVLMLFKRYMMTQAFLQYTMMRDALKGATPEVRRMARKQFIGTYAMLGMFSGVMGVPLYSLIADLIDLFKEDDELSFDASTRIAFGEVPYKGLLNHVTGLELASRVGLNDMFFREPIGNNSPSVYWDAAVGFGGPVVGLALAGERGVRMLFDSDPTVQARGVETILPAALRNMFFKAPRFASDGALTLRGDPVVDDLTAFQIGAQALGFSPANYIQQLELNKELKRIDTAARKKRSNLMRRYYIALRSRNYQEARSVMEDIREFNRKHRNHPITPDSIKQSLDRHEKSSREMQGGVIYSKKYQQEARRIQADWDNPWPNL